MLIAFLMALSCMAQTSVVSVTGKGYYQASVGGEPANWYMPGFDDSTWTAATQTSWTFNSPPFPGASQGMTPAASPEPAVPIGAEGLFRVAFTQATLPGVVTLQVVVDNYLTGVWMNGTPVSFATTVNAIYNGYPFSVGTVNIPAALVTTGSNVLAISIVNGPGSVFTINTMYIAMTMTTTPVLAPITGTFRLPTASAFNGKAIVSLVRPTVINTCGSTAQTLAFSPVTTSIVNGALGALSLYPTDCLTNGTYGNASIVGLSGTGNGGTVSITGQWTGTITAVVGATPPPNQAIARIGLIVPSQLSCYLLDTSPYPANATMTSTTVPRLSQTGIGRFITLIAPAGGLTAYAGYTWTYHCVQPYTVNVYDANRHLMYTAQWAVPGGGGDVTLADISEIGVVKQQ